MRLINADEIIYESIDEVDVTRELYKYGTGILAVRKEDIDEMPTAEPQIIRCKECKWFGSIGCAIEIVDDSDKPTEDDFCSFAERRDNE